MSELLQIGLSMFSPLALLGFALFSKNYQTNTVNSITNLVNDSVLSTLQQQTTNLTTTQQFDFSCDEEVLQQIANGQQACINNNAKFVRDGNYTPAELVAICRPTICTGNNLTISGSIFAQVLSNMTTETQQQIHNAVQNSLRAYASQSVSGIADQNNVLINNISNIVTQQMSKISQKDIDNISFNQYIKLSNYQFTQLSQTGVLNYVSTALMNNSSYQAAVTKLANNLSATSIQGSGSSLLKTLLYISLAIIILLIISGISWFVKMRRNKKKS